MAATEIVLAWDSALRAGDWEAARALLADTATYASPEMPEDIRVECASPDAIVDLMRSWKGQMPDVVVLKWETHDNQVLARLRQPEWGDDADWYQVLTVEGDRIVHLEDHPNRESAIGALTQTRAVSN